MSHSSNSSSASAVPSVVSDLTGVIGPLKSRSKTKQEAKNIYKKRSTGLYETQDTLDDAIMSCHHMKKTKDDKVFTLFHSTGCMNVYNMREILPQISLWKSQKCVLNPKNIWEIDCQEAGKALMFIIQPPEDMECDMSPLAMAFNKLVSGYAYITHDRGLLEVVKSALSPKPVAEMNYVEVVVEDKTPKAEAKAEGKTESKTEYNYCEVNPK